jgi:hypothetical protein
MTVVKYVFGKFGGCLKTAEEYNAYSKTFSQFMVSGNSRKGHTSTVLDDGKVLISGVDSNNNALLMRF